MVVAGEGGRFPGGTTTTNTVDLKNTFCVELVMNSTHKVVYLETFLKGFSFSLESVVENSTHAVVDSKTSF